MKETLRRLWARWQGHCSAQGERLPPAPWDEAIEPFIWDGNPDADGWCRWHPVEKARRSDIAAAAPDLPPMHPSIDAYFNAWWFCALEGRVGEHSLTLNPVAPGIELDAFLMVARSYWQSHGRRLERVPIGTEFTSSLQVVIDNGSGVVSIEDWERGTLQPLAPSLEALIDRFYA